MTSRILLADDSITIQKVVNLTFADEGIEVVAVSNGEQAERRLSEICPDLVLADIFMPGKNGYELCEFVKQSPQFRHVPVVLLVGAFEPFNEAEARRVRADAHLTKPFESRTLVDTVRKLISMSGRPSTGALPSEPLRGQEEVPALTPPPQASSVALPPSFNLDLSGMSPDWEVAQPAAQQQNSFADALDQTPLNNASPLELDYGAFATSDSAPSGFQVEAEEPAPTAGFSFARSIKDTAELPPIEPMQQASFDATPRGQTEPLQALPAFSQGQSEAEAGDTFGAPFEEPEDPQGFKVRSTFGDPGRDAVLDFDKLDAPASPAPDNIVSFDVDFSPTASDGAAAHEPVAEQPWASDTYEQSAAPGAGDIFGEPTTAPYVSEVFGEQSTTSDVSEVFGDMSFGLVQETTPQALSVDDPLGDVLSVDHPQMQPVDNTDGGLAFVAQPAEPPELVSAPVQELIEDATKASQFPFETEATAAQSERLGSVVHSGLSFEAFSPLPEEPAPFKAESSVWEEAAPFTTKSSVWEEPAPFKAESSVWEGTGGDDVLSLNQTAEAPTPEAENAFSASEMWAVAETEFAAIDIEAVAVEEPQSLADFGESPDLETGFAFASVAEPVAHQPVVKEFAPVETAVVSNAKDLEGLTLSPAVIDEIVRRVIAQMGDAVVREIAWEVVPDCVERVVEKLSHEAAAKRM